MFATRNVPPPFITSADEPQFEFLGVLEVGLDAGVERIYPDVRKRGPVAPVRDHVDRNEHDFS